MTNFVLLSVSLSTTILISAGSLTAYAYQYALKSSDGSSEKKYAEADYPTGIRSISSSHLLEEKIIDENQVKQMDFTKVLHQNVLPDHSFPKAVDPSSLGQEDHVLNSSIGTSSAAKIIIDEPRDDSPTLIVYEKEIVIEFTKQSATTQNVRHAVSRLLLSEDPFSESLFAKDSVSLQEKPYFYAKVKDHHNRKVKYPIQAKMFADYLLMNQATKISDSEGEFIQIRIPLEKNEVKGPGNKYMNWVKNYARVYEVSPALIYAIMETESAFNPKAVSKSNAIGLMQIKPNSAGRDVYAKIDQKRGAPTQRDLFDSRKNIRIGTAYLSLLEHEYFAEITNDENRKLMVIASYNGGLTTAMAVFGSNAKRAIARVNQLHPKQVYRKLNKEHESDETRRYMKKVVEAEKRYKTLDKALENTTYARAS